MNQLIAAPNFENFLEQRGYSELEVEERPSGYKFRRDFSVRHAGEEIGTYTIVFEGDLIFSQSFEEKKPGYLDPQTSDRVRLHVTRTPPSVLDEISWEDAYPTPEKSMKRIQKLREEREFLRRTPLSDLPLRRNDPYPSIPFP